jgi:prepilin-type N-terminal cleavage/methylation domain-containing protein
MRKKDQTFPDFPYDALMNERTFAVLPKNGRRFPMQRDQRARAFTLVEVMIALIVIGTSALGGLSGMMFAYRVSDANLRALAALADARSVAEQILTLDANTLAGATDPEETDATLPVDIPSSLVRSLEVNKGNDKWNARTDDMHGTPDNPKDDLALSLQLEVVQPDAVTGFMCSQVIIHFRWTENSFFAPHVREDALTVVVSHIPTH